MDGLKCCLCGKTYKAKSFLLGHRGSKHGNINDLPKEENSGALPCLINTSSTIDTQANLEVRIHIINKKPFSDIPNIKNGKFEDNYEAIEKFKI